jgi:hypothetical protein
MNSSFRYKFAVVAVCTSIAVALGLALYEGYIPIQAAHNSIEQAAGQAPGGGVKRREGVPAWADRNNK